MTDDDRSRVLSRRAKFVAAALASVMLDGCKPQVCLSQPNPNPCLSVNPEPCLSPPPQDPPPDAAVEPPRPEVCLSQPPPDPQPLEPKPPGPFAEPPPGKT